MKWLELKCVAKLLIVVLVSTASAVFAGNVPQTLNYQGTLTDSTGNPVTANAQSVTFNLYTSALGGTAFWTEPQTVSVNNGQFSAVLGSTLPVPVDQFTGNTFVGVTIGNGPEMLPRQKLTSVAYALKAADAIPKGVIVMWSGASNQIPSGWAMCDGKNGSPDLRDRFVLGAGGSLPANGGSSSHSHTINATDINHRHYTDHNHTGTTNGTSYGGIVRRGSDDPFYLTVDSHTHGFTTNGMNGRQFTDYMESNNSHTHTENSQPNIPPYYALAFIIKL